MRTLLQLSSEINKAGEESTSAYAKWGSLLIEAQTRVKNETKLLESGA